MELLGVGAAVAVDDVEGLTVALGWFAPWPPLTPDTGAVEAAVDGVGLSDGVGVADADELGLTVAELLSAAAEPVEVAAEPEDAAEAAGVTAVAAALAELLGCGGAPVEATALVTGLGSPPAAGLAEEVRTVEVAGGEPHELCAEAAGAPAARMPTSNSAKPKRPSPIAAPTAAGLRSSALTVHPRFS